MATKRFNCEMSYELYEALQEVAFKEKRKMSEIVRELVDAYINKEGEK